MVVEREGAVAVGTLVRFDSAQGYGFITPDDGGDDVFLHVSLFEEDVRPQIRRGMRIEFHAVTGDRGAKAVRAHPVDDMSAPAMRRLDPRAGEIRGRTRDDDELCDVLSVAEYAQQITDVLIDAVPAITGAQIMRVRQQLVAFAQQRGWVDG